MKAKLNWRVVVSCCIIVLVVLSIYYLHLGRSHVKDYRMIEIGQGQTDVSKMTINKRTAVL